MVLATVITALAAVMYTAFTIWLTLETKRLRDLAENPYVTLHVEHDSLRPSVLILIISNSGRSVARDVTFDSDRAIPVGAFGIEEPEVKDMKWFRTDGVFNHGIPALAPGERRLLTWGQFGGIRKATEGQPIKVTISYSNGRTKLRTASVLDIRSFEGNDSSTRDPLLRIAQAVEEIQERLDQK